MKQADEESRRHFLKLSSMLGLAVAFSPETIAGTFADSKSRTKKENIMTQPSATGTEQAADKTAIRPFQFNFSDAELTDLRRRVNATRWPDREQVSDEHKACSSPRCRNSRAIGEPTMTGARARPS